MLYALLASFEFAPCTLQHHYMSHQAFPSLSSRSHWDQFLEARESVYDVHYRDHQLRNDRLKVNPKIERSTSSVSLILYFSHVYKKLA